MRLTGLNVIYQPFVKLDLYGPFPIINDMIDLVNDEILMIGLLQSRCGDGLHQLHPVVVENPALEARPGAISRGTSIMVKIWQI